MDNYNRNIYDNYLDVFKLFFKKYKNNEFVKKHEKLSKVLVVLGIPIWTAIVLFIIAFLLVFYILIWATVTIFVIGFLVIYIFSLLSIVFGVMRMFEYGFLNGLFGVGVGLFLVGASLVLVNPIIRLLKKLCHSTRTPIHKLTVFFTKEF